MSSLRQQKYTHKFSLPLAQRIYFNIEPSCLMPTVNFQAFPKYDSWVKWPLTNIIPWNIYTWLTHLKGGQNFSARLSRGGQILSARLSRGGQILSVRNFRICPGPPHPERMTAPYALYWSYLEHYQCMLTLLSAGCIVFSSVKVTIVKNSSLNIWSLYVSFTN